MLVGKHAAVRPHDVQLYCNNPYIEIGNHSYTHANDHYAAYYSNPEGVLADFMRNMDSLQLTTKIGRLPGRNMWRVNQRSRNDISSGIEAADLLHKNGYSLFGWDLEWMHDPHTAEPIGTAGEIFSQIEKTIEQNRVFTSNHFVLLCHDEMFQNDYEESELRKLIKLLKQKMNINSPKSEITPNQTTENRQYKQETNDLNCLWHHIFFCYIYHKFIVFGRSST
jgi:hypothetical protein